MKKLFCMLLTAALCLLLTAALADGVSLQEALAMVGQPDCPDLIELNDDLTNLNFITGPEYTPNEGKTIVVLREAPLKKYENSYTSYPSDYMGVDDGEPKTYLYASIMKDMPEDQRALTVEEIGTVLMGESLYMISAEISTTENVDENDKASDTVLDLILAGETEQAEAMQKLQEEQEADRAVIVEYTPVYAGLGMVNLYSWEDGGGLNLALESFPDPEIRDNPEAADYWEAILEAVDIAQYAYAGDLEGAAAYIEEKANYLDEELLESMLTMDVVPLYAACDAEIWRCAELMAQADGDAETMAQYAEVIAARNLSALAYIVNARAYNAVGFNDVTIQILDLYTGKVDMEVVKAELMEIVEIMEMDLVSWDPSMLCLVLYLGL